MEVVIQFHPRFTTPMLDGVKILTARHERKGVAGDTFQAFGAWFILRAVFQWPLGDLKRYWWRQEGCESPDHFKAVWTSLHPDAPYDSHTIVWVHQFQKVVEAAPTGAPATIPSGNPYWYTATIINVVDGDTIDAMIDVGFKMTTVQRVRLLAVDTAELHDKDHGERVRAQLAKEWMVTTTLGKPCVIHTEKADAFGRYLAMVYIDGHCVNLMLVQQGWAR
mgnify:CR=1 FL=1